MNILNWPVAFFLTTSELSEYNPRRRNKDENEIYCTYLLKEVYPIENLTINNTVVNQNLNDVLLQLSLLNDNWDGYGAYSPSELVLTNIEEFISLLPNKFIEFLSEDNIYPNPHGTITIEWENSNNEIASVEIGDYTTNFYAKLCDKSLYTESNIFKNNIIKPSALLIINSIL